MRAGEMWRMLLKKIGEEGGVYPDEFEVFNGTVVFWFQDSGAVKGVLKKMKERGVLYEIEWDREEGLMGIAIKKSFFM